MNGNWDELEQTLHNRSELKRIRCAKPHAYFAGLFGLRETRERSGHYLQTLLVQSGERRNADNLSETVPKSARWMQLFLTDSP